MRCYYVLVQGSFEWQSGRSASDEFGAAKPAGFYAHRYVLAANQAEAIKATFRRVRDNLDRQFGWFRDGLATVELRAEEVEPAPIHKLLKSDNRGHSFYSQE